MIAVIIVQSRLKLYDFTILAAGVEMEQVCNPFASRQETKTVFLLSVLMRGMVFAGWRSGKHENSNEKGREPNQMTRS